MTSRAEPGWLLRAWEAGSPCPPPARAAVLAHVSGATSTLEEALDLGVGELAAALAQIHLRQFGRVAQGTITCHGCDEVLDVEVPMTGFAEPASVGAATTVTTPSGHRLLVRVPSTRDLLATANAADVVAALTARCVHEASDPDQHPQPLDPPEQAVVDDALESLAGGAATAVRAECPSCATPLRAPVDIAAFVWAGIEREAPTVLSDVALLARRFGWSEHEILELSAQRREAYLTLARGVPA